MATSPEIQYRALHAVIGWNFSRPEGHQNEDLDLLISDLATDLIMALPDEALRMRVCDRIRRDVICETDEQQRGEGDHS